MLLFMPDTVECERNFSKMNLIKTPLRNLLQKTTLDDLMTISINFGKLGFDHICFINKVIQEWKNMASRRNIKFSTTKNKRNN